jgi:hypothetical protein
MSPDFHMVCIIRVWLSYGQCALPYKYQHSIPGALSASNQDSEIPRAAVEAGTFPNL